MSVQKNICTSAHSVCIHTFEEQARLQCTRAESAAKVWWNNRETRMCDSANMRCTLRFPRRVGAILIASAFCCIGCRASLFHFPYHGLGLFDVGIQLAQLELQSVTVRS